MTRDIAEDGSEESTHVEAGEDESEGESEQMRSHLEEIEDGCGCAEVWEHLSEHRAND